MGEAPAGHVNFIEPALLYKTWPGVALPVFVTLLTCNSNATGAYHISNSTLLEFVSTLRAHRTSKKELDSALNFLEGKGLIKRYNHNVVWLTTRWQYNRNKDLDKNRRGAHKLLASLDASLLADFEHRYGVLDTTKDLSYDTTKDISRDGTQRNTNNEIRTTNNEIRKSKTGAQAPPALSDSDLAVLQNCIKTINPEADGAAPIKQEIEAYRYLAKRYSPETILAVVRWGCADDFWSANIRGFTPLTRAKIAGDAIKFEKVRLAMEKASKQRKSAAYHDKPPEDRLKNLWPGTIVATEDDAE